MRRDLGPSTFERIMKDKKRKIQFDKGYRNFLLSELITALMERDHVSVRQLAKEAKISPTVVQSIRSGHQKDLMTQNFLTIIDKLGFDFELREREGPKMIVISVENNQIIARPSDKHLR
ncbi:MAG: hypothetical protein HRT90_12285 [Candidatus Margulisbacteria bacterium]|nr:hypothetical protein [Candidatus Margulisiibacteriota bacterium]